jgi:anti-sigma regulatory factor (Ser/Thr protein kinase)
MKPDVKNKSSTTDTPVELQVCANPDCLGTARQAVRHFARTIGLDDKETESITLAVVEALTNVIRHGYGGPCDEPIFMKLDKINFGDEAKPALEIVIRDFGKDVDPECIKGRDLGDVRPGGVGVHIIRSVMDEIEYKKADGGGMQLRMLKYIK